MTPLRQRMIEDMRVRNLSPNTQQLYVDRVAKFAQYFGKSPELLGPEDVRTYQVYLIHQKRACSSMLQQTVCALRFLYRNTLGKEWALPYIPSPRREKKLPVVLSQEEVSRFFDNLPNLKHRAIVMTAYATGMRVSEVVSLRVADIDSVRMMIRWASWTTAKLSGIFTFSTRAPAFFSRPRTAEVFSQTWLSAFFR